MTKTITPKKKRISCRHNESKYKSIHKLLIRAVNREQKALESKMKKKKVSFVYASKILAGRLL